MHQFGSSPHISILSTSGLTTHLVTPLGEAFTVGIAPGNTAGRMPIMASIILLTYLG
jgi:hypothetical protein